MRGGQAGRGTLYKKDRGLHFELKEGVEGPPENGPIRNHHCPVPSHPSSVECGVGSTEEGTERGRRAINGTGDGE